MTAALDRSGVTMTETAISRNVFVDMQIPVISYPLRIGNPSGLRE